jgi:hypothetical protein
MARPTSDTSTPNSSRPLPKRTNNKKKKKQTSSSSLKWKKRSWLQEPKPKQHKSKVLLVNNCHHRYVVNLDVGNKENCWVVTTTTTNTNTVNKPTTVIPSVVDKIFYEKTIVEHNSVSSKIYKGHEHSVNVKSKKKLIKKENSQQQQQHKYKQVHFQDGNSTNGQLLEILRHSLDPDTTPTNYSSNNLFNSFGNEEWMIPEYNLLEEEEVFIDDRLNWYDDHDFLVDIRNDVPVYQFTYDANCNECGPGE